MGLAYAVPGWSNQNLLINADFRKPVNRRGQAEYTSTGLAIDRWYFDSIDTSLSVHEGGLHFACGPEANGSQGISQEVKNPGRLSGCVVTYSVVASTAASIGMLLLINGTILEESGINSGVFSGEKVISKTITLPRDIEAMRVYFYPHNAVGAGEGDIVATKLELGSQQTLAHQDADGGWVLNDPPDYALQYALCSLYSPITGEWVGSQHSNQNLLDNWYFADAVNQRGRTEYEVAGAAYTIDRWLLSQAEAKVLSVVENGISIEPGSVLIQKLEPGRIQDGSQITMSVMINHIVFSASMRWDSSAGYANLTTQYGFRLACDPSNRYVQIYNESGSGEDVINAVKLELGAQQTLAHQDADGKWVLNDPPPNKALELVKCQRYQFIPTPYHDNIYCFAVGVGVGSVAIDFFVPLPTTMRAKHTITLQNLYAYDGVSKLPITSCSNYGTVGNGTWMRAAVEGAIAGRAYYLRSENPFSFIFDANL